MNLQMARLRKEKGLLQKDVAKRLGVQTFTYGAWERGDRKFSFGVACDIADILGCTLDALAGREVPSDAFSGDASILVACFNRCTPKRRDRLIEEAVDYARVSGGERDALSKSA